MFKREQEEPESQIDAIALYRSIKRLPYGTYTLHVEAVGTSMRPEAIIQWSTNTKQFQFGGEGKAPDPIESIRNAQLDAINAAWGMLPALFRMPMLRVDHEAFLRLETALNRLRNLTG